MQVDIIGEIVRYDEAGEALETLPGWHVNVAESDMTPELEEYRVHPTAPARVFAGDVPDYTMTAFLRFESEAAAVEVLGAE